MLRFATRPDKTFREIVAECIGVALEQFAPLDWHARRRVEIGLEHLRHVPGIEAAEIARRHPRCCTGPDGPGEPQISGFSVSTAIVMPTTQATIANNSALRARD